MAAADPTTRDHPPRPTLHALAEQVDPDPLRVQATGNEIALRCGPAGFGDARPARGGWVGTDGTDSPRVDADGARETIADHVLADAADFAGLDDAASALTDARLELHAGAAQASPTSGRPAQRRWSPSAATTPSRSSGPSTSTSRSARRQRDLRRLTRRRRPPRALRLHLALDAARRPQDGPQHLLERRRLHRTPRPAGGRQRPRRDRRVLPRGPRATRRRVGPGEDDDSERVL